MAFKPRGTDKVRIAGIEAFKSFTTSDPIADGAATVELDVTYTGDRFTVTECRVTGRKGAPVTSDMLRHVRVAELLAEGVAANLGDAVRLFERPDSSKGPTDDNLKAVAKVYALAYATGNRPKQAVAKAFGIPVSTASRWIRKARDHPDNYLGEPPKQGKAGI